MKSLVQYNANLRNVHDEDVYFVSKGFVEVSYISDEELDEKMRNYIKKHEENNLKCYDLKYWKVDSI